MPPSLEEFKAEIEKVLESLKQEKGEEIVRMVKPILLTNLDRGRIQLFVDSQVSRVREYAWQVARNYPELNPYLHQLQSEKVSNVWEPLFERMRTWAYNFLVRKGFKADETTQDIANECATEAAVNILGAYFPYDTEFDPWAHVIVQNACRKFIRKGMKKSAIPEESIVDIDDEMVSLVDPPIENRGGAEEPVTDLKEALSYLSNSRRQVLELIYFEGLSPEEAARKMKKSIGAIYSLQFNALVDLRKILSKIGDSLNE